MIVHNPIHTPSGILTAPTPIVKQWHINAFPYLQGWWVADPAYVTKDSLNRVSLMTDISGNGINLIQNTAANQPLWIDSQANGYPVVRLDTVTRTLVTTKAFPVVVSNTIVLVIKPQLWLDGRAVVSGIGYARNQGTVYPNIKTSSTAFTYTSGTTAGPSICNLSFVMLTDNAVNLSRIFINDVVRGSSAFGSGGGTSITLGSASTAALVDFAEVLLFRQDMTPYYQMLSNYFCSKYNINRMVP